MSRYSPGALSPEARRRRFVGRWDLVGRLRQGVLGALADGGARYDLVVGPRGSGKTHLLMVLVDALAEDLDPAESALVGLAEEEHVSSLTALNARILAVLDPDGGSVATLLAMPAREAPDASERMVLAHLEDRAMVLVLENLDRVFQAIGVQGQKRLRALLHNHGRITIVAGSQTAGPAFLHRGQPFYGTFTRLPLGPLSPEDCQEMLRRLAGEAGDEALAEAVTGPGGLARIRAVHQFSGGLPRSMALLFPYLDVQTFDSVEDAFGQVADELTPYFQEQARSRSPGQQAILELLAESWSPLAVKEIARQTFTAEQSTSGQLRHLRADGLVQDRPVGRERFYEIRDPLWRVARAMKRPDRIPQTLLRFVRFLSPREARADLLRQLDPSGALVEELEQEAAEGQFVERLMVRIERAWASGAGEEALELSEDLYRTMPGRLSAGVLVAVTACGGGAGPYEALRDLHGGLEAPAAMFARVLGGREPLLPVLASSLREHLPEAHAQLGLFWLGQLDPEELGEVLGVLSEDMQHRVLHAVRWFGPAYRKEVLQTLLPQSTRVALAQAGLLFEMARFQEALTLLRSQVFEETVAAHMDPLELAMPGFRVERASPGVVALHEAIVHGRRPHEASWTDLALWLMLAIERRSVPAGRLAEWATADDPELLGALLALLLDGWTPPGPLGEASLAGKLQRMIEGRPERMPAELRRVLRLHRAFRGDPPQEE